jgi:O-antigen/teichoic acid export membrane protein
MRLNAIFLLVGRVVSAITTVLVLAIMARTRSADDLGVVSLGLTVSLALAVLPEAGLTALFVRESARDPERTGLLLGAMIAIRLVALPLGFVAISALVLLAYPHVAGTIMLVALGPALQQVSELGRAVFISRQRMAVAGAHTVVENIAWLGAIAVCLLTGVGLDGAFAVAAAVMAISAAVAFTLVVVLARVRPVKPPMAEIRWLLRQAGPFTLFSALVVVDLRMDTFLLGLLLPQGLAVAGIYYAVTRLVGVAEYIPDAVSRAIFPRMSREFAERPAWAAATLASATKELLALGIAIPFGFALFGSWLIGLLYGPSFTAYTWLLVAFGVAMPFRYIGLIFGGALTSAGHQSWRVRALAIAVGVSFILNLALIPVIGVTGALIAVTASWVSNCVLNIVDVDRVFGHVISPRDLVTFLGLAALAFLAGVTVRTVVGGPLGDPIAGITFAGVGLLGMFGPALRRRLRASSTVDAE